MAVAVIAAPAGALAQGAATPSEENQVATTWTAIIPEAFPGFVYAWRAKSDGTYKEDGRDGRTGQSIQPTLTGHWQIEGNRMILRQDDLPYVFVGTVGGNRYIGTLYLAGRKVSYFCAVMGDSPPPSCDAELSVSVRPLHFSHGRPGANIQIKRVRPDFGRHVPLLSLGRAGEPAA